MAPALDGPVGGGRAADAAGGAIFLDGPVGARRAAGPRGGDLTPCVGSGGSWGVGLDGSRGTGGGAGAGCCGVCSRDCCCDRAMLEARRGEEIRECGWEYIAGDWAVLLGGVARAGAGRSSRLGGLLDRGRYVPPRGPVGGVLLNGDLSRGKRSLGGGDLDGLLSLLLVSQT